MVDNLTALALIYLGFKHYAPSRWFQAFPPRPFSLFSKSAATNHFPYWYRPHKSPSKKPIIFIHGIGIGLFPYVPFVRDLISVDPDVGLLLIELVPIMMHMTPYPIPSRTVMLDAISQTLDTLGIDKATLATHSYGTTIGAHIIRSHQPPPTSPPISESAALPSPDLDQTSTNPLISSPLASKITSILLIDPIPILLHLPDVAFNFLYRQPSSANHWQLWYFASRDADIARALSRHLFWQECLLWKEDILPPPAAIHTPNEDDRATSGQEWSGSVAVVLSGNDQIVAASKVWSYLTGGQPISISSSSPMDKWESSSDAVEQDAKSKLQVLFYHGLDHATVFDTRDRRKGLVDVLNGFVR